MPRMDIRILFCLRAAFCLALLPAVGEEAPWVRVHLRNENTLDARLVGFENDVLSIHPRWSRTPSGVGFRFLEGFTVLRDPPCGSAPQRASLHLTNGDHLAGEIQGISGEWLEWKSPWGKTLRVRRDMVERVEIPYPPDRVLDHGVLPVSLWEIQSRGSNATNPEKLAGSLVMPRGGASTVIRSLPPLPEKFFFEFTFAARGNPLNYGVNVLGRDGSTREAGVLVLNVNIRQVIARVIDENGRMQQLVRIQADGDNENHRQRFRIYVDATRGRAWLEIEGHPPVDWEIGEWVEPGAEQAVFSLRVQQAQSVFLVERYQFVEWNGKLPSQDVPPDRPELDTFYNRENDFFQGKWTGIRDNRFVLSLEDGKEKHIGMDAVSLIHPATSRIQTPRRQSRDVQVRFPNARGRLTLRLRAMDDEALYAAGEAWEEELRIPLHAFESVRFNLAPHQTAWKRWSR